jgi:hypothetical protein
MSEIFLSSKITEENAKKAAKWWADILRNGAKMDIAKKERKQLPPEKIDAFEKSLTELILEKNPACLSFEFAPDVKLYEAAERVGVELDDVGLPWITNMFFEKGLVKVRRGYGAALEVLK